MAAEQWPRQLAEIRRKLEAGVDRVSKEQATLGQSERDYPSIMPGADDTAV